MRVNLEEDEHVIAALPKIWAIVLGLMGFFNKSKEGILVLTNKNLIFVPRYLYVLQKEREKYFGEDKVKVTQLWDYSETQLDEDISENSKSWTMPLESIIDVTQITLRKVNFMRIKFSSNGKEKTYDFGIAKSVTNYPIRQPLLFYNVDWIAWIDLLKSRI
ncbi:MAG: hypothetical protein E6L02_00245 [Thaumarchaeota archaeon]|nr:MAG: hypothetical protein E6L02_00245 [Nitrososphaerota archaeon]